MHGDHDIRPAWAVDSLHHALPRGERVTLANAGHVPWVEAADQFREAVTTFLRVNTARNDPPPRP
ncbi:alpha/beta fold hydrolase [Phytohabitans kaempferiae]|uniref:Alpha/beta fold hydrolase n=1 Tax=Phytohabitans kaempferiae TaxID=1620943 RepID=A0ABV6MAU3_9ACTN